MESTSTMTPLYWSLLGIFLLMLVLGNRERINRYINRIDEKIRAKHAADERDKRDPLAHFYITVAEIDARTPHPDPNHPGAARYTWMGEVFSSWENAGEARRAHVLAEARRFYLEIDGRVSLDASARRTRDHLRMIEGGKKEG